MRRRIAIGVVAAVMCGSGVVFARYGLWEATTSPVFPVLDPVNLVCYAVESGYTLHSVPPRPDVLAVFVKSTKAGELSRICYLRPVTAPFWVVP